MKDYTSAEKSIYIIDGQHFSTLEEFAETFSQVVLPDWCWQGNLDAFNDILAGGFGTPEEGFILVWKNSHLSKTRLGYEEAVRQLHHRLEQCHPTNRGRVAQELTQAQQQLGPTVFDWLIEIIRDHQDIELRLE